MANAVIETSIHQLRLEGDPGSFKVFISAKKLEDGRDLVSLKLESPEPSTPPAVRLVWTHPCVNIQGSWYPGVGRNRALSPCWGGGFHSRSTSQAPVMCLYSASGRNQLTFACSDALNDLQLSAGVIEETSEFECQIGFFAESASVLTCYEAQVLLDTREVLYSEALDAVRIWWEKMPGHEPAPVPDAARKPMYSTWYSFHQSLQSDAVETQCRLSHELGCDTVIEDDGWQTMDTHRGYAFCGDWKPDRIPYLADHVKRVHEAGMKFVLWYSVPFVGVHSAAFKRFQGKFLNNRDVIDVGVLDPRFPEVREYLIQIYETALRAWDLDGFKLDFVDDFRMRDRGLEKGAGRDCDSVPEAADRLLSDVLCRLRQIKPEIMIEFRQSYIGPLMRKYGNMLRAGDCPNDAVSNRVSTLDLRLLSGQTAVHGDMMMWNPAESVECAALQLLNVLFAVPQVSVLIDKIPDTHVEMLRFWLKFWLAHRETLLDGKLDPQQPHLLYPAVTAISPHEVIAAVYSLVVVRCHSVTDKSLYLVNASTSEQIVVDLVENLGKRRVRVYDCQGDLICDAEENWEMGIRAIRVPASGLAEILPA